MTGFVLAIASALAVGLAKQEIFGALRTLARRLVGSAAQRLPTRSQGRYTEEWLAELDAIGDRPISAFLFAYRTRRRARALVEALHEGAQRDSASPAQILQHLYRGVPLRALLDFLSLIAIFGSMYRQSGPSPMVAMLVILPLSMRGALVPLGHFRSRTAAALMHVVEALSLSALVLGIPMLQPLVAFGLALLATASSSASRARHQALLKTALVRSDLQLSPGELDRYVRVTRVSRIVAPVTAGVIVTGLSPSIGIGVAAVIALALAAQTGLSGIRQDLAVEDLEEVHAPGPCPQRRSVALTELVLAAASASFAPLLPAHVLESGMRVDLAYTFLLTFLGIGSILGGLLAHSALARSDRRYPVSPGGLIATLGGYAILCGIPPSHFVLVCLGMTLIGGGVTVLHHRHAYATMWLREGSGHDLLSVRRKANVAGVACGLALGGVAVTSVGPLAVLPLVVLGAALSISVASGARRHGAT